MKQEFCIHCGKFVHAGDEGKHFFGHLLGVAALVLGAVIIATLWALITE